MTAAPSSPEASIDPLLARTSSAGAGSEPFDADEFLREQPASDNAVFLRIERKIELSPDLKIVKQEHDLRFTTKGPSPEKIYCHRIASDQVSDIFATDSRGGGLRFDVEKTARSETILTIHFPEPVATGKTYEFKFGYKAALSHLISTRSTFSRVAVFSDYQVTDIPCEQLRITVQAPKSFNVLSTRPTTDNASRPLIFDSSAIRSKELYSFLVVYEKRDLARAALWFGSAVVSGIAGTIVAKLIGF